MGTNPFKYIFQSEKDDSIILQKGIESAMRKAKADIPLTENEKQLLRYVHDSEIEKIVDVAMGATGTIASKTEKAFNLMKQGYNKGLGFTKRGYGKAIDFTKQGYNVSKDYMKAHPYITGGTVAGVGSTVALSDYLFGSGDSNRSEYVTTPKPVAVKPAAPQPAARPKTVGQRIAKAWSDNETRMISDASGIPMTTEQRVQLGREIFGSDNPYRGTAEQNRKLAEVLRNRAMNIMRPSTEVQQRSIETNKDWR